MEVGKSRIKVPACLGESPLLGCKILVSSHGENRGRELAGVPLVRALIPFPRRDTVR